MSKKIQSITPDEPGLTTNYGSDYTANAFAIYDPESGETLYQTSYHKGDMPAFGGKIFKTREELEAEMRDVQPDMRRWRTNRESD